MKSSKINWWQDTMQLVGYLKDRLILSVVVGIVTLILTITLKEYYWEYAPDINTAVLVALFIFFLYIAKDAYKIFELRNRIEKADKVYHDLIDAHINLPNVYPKFIDDRILEEKTQNGLVFINVQDADYSNWLELCAANAKHTLFTTLTGRYLPDFFFPVDGNTRFIDYIEKTNKFKIVKKIRIYIFPKEAFINSLSKLNIDQIKKFFECQNNFTIYYLDKEKFIREHVSSFSDIHIAINCDFALFDNSLAFRRIDDLELAYYFTNSEVKTLPCSFRKLFENEILEKDCFLLINKEKITQQIDKDALINEIKNQIKL